MIAVSLIPFAGQGWAGERQADVAGMETLGEAPEGQAWIGEYHIDDAQGGHALTVVRGRERVEYRRPGLPTRVWRKVADGVELKEVDLAHRLVTTFSPGDLRALDHEPTWNGIAMPACADTTAHCGWRLQTSHLATEAEAFTALDAYREVDGIDQGD